ncbi:hypothetical protein OG333_33380 [Streptomyces anulatus]|nr:hypothetical protein [Streptomyces sp. or20]WSV78961.1 hypothetical protein OG333_33380 [Streptomyces anulatus]
MEPRLVIPGREGDYFSGEQVTTWGIDQFWGLPQYPHTPFYRTFETAVDADAHLYEFVVPMVPPTWNERERVEEYVALMEQGTVPTAGWSGRHRPAACLAHAIPHGPPDRAVLVSWRSVVRSSAQVSSRAAHLGWAIRGRS